MTAKRKPKKVTKARRKAAQQPPEPILVAQLDSRTWWQRVCDFMQGKP